MLHIAAAAARITTTTSANITDQYCIGASIRRGRGVVSGTTVRALVLGRFSQKN